MLPLWFSCDKHGTDQETLGIMDTSLPRFPSALTHKKAALQRSPCSAAFFMFIYNPLFNGLNLYSIMYNLIS